MNNINMIKGYSICPNKWLKDKEIRNELPLLLLISSLNSNGVCTVSNSYFAEFFEETEVTISRKLSKLKAKGYIKINYERRGAEVISREIELG